MSAAAFLTEGELSALIKVPTKSLQRWRWAGFGPKFVKLGHAVRYRRSDIDDWIAAQTRTSTTDAGAER